MLVGAGKSTVVGLASGGDIPAGVSRTALLLGVEFLLLRGSSVFSRKPFN